ncbi:acyloxyacyl hydrolase [Motiliproteus sp.]|uniref:acyloxyacyl hydrolase n=1 Tax=Motiliproteus sp. TaxID=1898955 RepID=UPI003BA9E1F8
MQKTLALIVLAAVTSLFGSVAYAESRWVVGAGALRAFDDDQLATGKLAYEWGPMDQYWNVRPYAQLLASDTDDYYLGVGALKQVPLGRKFAVGISFSAGYYHQGSDKLGQELDHDVEFYSALMLDYQLSSETQLRLELGHISNAGLGDENEGTESLILSIVFAR